jgi:hypothetical protein
MAITFSVKVGSYPDNQTDAALQTAIKATLDAASATTVHNITVLRYYGMIHVIMAYA